MVRSAVRSRRARRCAAYNQNKTDLDKEAIFLPSKKIAVSGFFLKTAAAPVAATTAAATMAAKRKEDASSFFKTKKRHTICSRTHHYVKAGVVDHLLRPDITACADIASNFCFCPQLSSCGGSLLTVPNTTAMVERSCYECASCFTLDKAKCKLTKYTGCAVSRPFKVNASNGSGLVSLRVKRQAELKNRLSKKIKAGTNVAVCITEEDGKYTWALAKATGPPRKAHAGEKDHDNGALGAGSLVVDVHQYEILKADSTEFGSYAEAQDAFETDPQSVAYCLRTPLGECDAQWCNCGTSVGCMKQHRQTYKLSQLREPAGFRMSTPKQADVRRTRRNKPDAPLSYTLSTGVLQGILQNIGALDVS
jgi:hypothetical protein